MATMSKKIISLAISLILISLQDLAWAGDYGIATDYGDVMIDNVGIGRSYNLRDIAGKPLKVKNTGKNTVTLIMDVQVPPEKDITDARKDLGFKPIPSANWVSLSQTQFVVPNGESAFSDVILNIPDDPSLYGKKFQVGIYSRTVDKGFLNVGVWTNIFMSIIASPEVQAEMEKNKKKGFVGSMDYTLLPDKLIIQNAPIGRKMNIAKEMKRTIKFANSGQDPIELRAKVIPVGESPVGLQEGFQEAGDLAWLKLASNVVKVDGDSFADPGLTLDLPNDPSLHQKKIMFIIKVDPANPDIVGVTYYGKVYVEVQ